MGVSFFGVFGFFGECLSVGMGENGVNATVFASSSASGFMVKSRSRCNICKVFGMNLL